MDAHALEILEFNKLKNIVGSFAVSNLGRNLIENIPISDSSDEIRYQFDLAREMIGIFESIHSLPVDGITDIRGPVEKIKPLDSYLEPNEFLKIYDLLTAVKNLRYFFSTNEKNYPLLFDIAQYLEPIPDYQKQVGKIFNIEAEIKDSASPNLQQIRIEKRETSQKIEDSLTKFIHSPKTRLFLQDIFITQRNNRNVLPIKVEYKNQVPGIIHDYSITGETAFIEPLNIVELSNELIDLNLEEQKEIRRILTALANILRENYEILSKNIDIVAQLDMIYAKANFAIQHKCSIPSVDVGNSLRIENGKHPLLLISLKEKCVPLNLHLKEDDHALIISGPNAGGKTTAAKTVGILSLMVQSSIPIPADSSSIFPVFTDFFADIGDEQNLTEGISTFSSHLRQVKYILEKASEKSLIILDELGTATDPSEGSLLARAILEELAARNTLTFVTSHLPALKTLDRTYNWVRTASFTLDPETERPNFVLSMDIPGDSNALKVAKLLGIPGKIIDRSYSLMSREERELKSIIDSMKKERQKLKKTTKEIEGQKALIEKSRKRYYALIDSLEAEKRKLKENYLREKENALREREKIINEARKQVEKMIAHLPSRADILRAKKDLKAEAEKIGAETEETKKKLKKLRMTATKQLKIEDIKPGMSVWIKNLDEKGVIKQVSRNKKQVSVIINKVEFKVKIDELESIEAEELKKSKPPRRGTVSTPSKVLSRNEINLVGNKVEDAIRKLDKYIDDAILAGFDKIKIIHGYGTGALRDGIRKFLKSHPQIKKYRDGDQYEGETAVTIASLK